MLAVVLVVLVVAVAGRVLLAAAVIAGIQWAVINYWAENQTLIWVVLGVPALLAGYTLADALTGSTGLGSSSVTAAEEVRGDEHAAGPMPGATGGHGAVGLDAVLDAEVVETDPGPRARGRRWSGGGWSPSAAGARRPAGADVAGGPRRRRAGRHGAVALPPRWSAGW